MKKFSILLIMIFLSGCTTNIKNPEDVANSIKMTIGASDCIGCNQIKTFISGTVGSRFYSRKDKSGMNSGGWISPSVQLGITNKNAILLSQDVSNNLFNSLIYAKTPTGNGHIFEGKIKANGNHPYRFFISVRQNSSFGSQESYIVNDGEFINMPAVKFQGEIPDRSCFDKGCVWNETYAIPATLVYKSIENNNPLKLFFGNKVIRQVPSKDGLNKAYNTFNEGALIEIKPEYLKAFIDKVESSLSI